MILKTIVDFTEGAIGWCFIAAFIAIVIVRRRRSTRRPRQVAAELPDQLNDPNCACRNCP